MNEVNVDARSVSKSAPDERLGSKIRASFLLAGPLLARFGRASMPPPGGDVIGRRRLDPHLHAFSELGAEIDLTGHLYELEAKNLHGASVFLDEASVMATENTIMAAVLARGQTVLGNAACEPHVQDLCRFLVSLGAQIDGIESNVLRITGVESLRGGSWFVGPDHIEVGSFIGMAAITGGDITIEGVRKDDLVSIIPAFGKLGVRVEVGEDTVHVPTNQQLIVEDDLGGMVPKIEDGPWPAFPVGSHLDRTDGRDASVRNGAHVREDVREPPVLHRQAGLDGSAHHPVRSASRRRHRACEARRPTDGEPRHPRRHGDAARGAVGRRTVDDRRRAPDRQGVRAHRRAPASARRVDRARRLLKDAARGRSRSRHRSHRSRAHRCARRGPRPSPAAP